MRDFSVAAVFSDYCVLQRDRDFFVFGYSKDFYGKTVYVSLKSAEGKVISSASSIIDGAKWIVRLPAVKAREECTLEVLCSDFFKAFSHVAVGEVWLAGGQSNMEFEAASCSESEEILKCNSDQKVRFYYTQKIGWMDEDFFAREKLTHWETSDSQSKKYWSAIGYFFARELSEKLGITIGIIGCNWGGTSASCWIDRQSMEEEKYLEPYFEPYKKESENKSIEEQCSIFDSYTEYHESWQKKCDELYKKNPDIQWAQVIESIGQCKWPGPKVCKNPFRPAGLYECMVSRIAPYSLKGVLFYQGESDDHQSSLYDRLFTLLIKKWRQYFADPLMPFIFVQLPEHRYIADKDFKNWCLIRENQLKVRNLVRNAFMVSALDQGAYNDIHPKHKKILALRMASCALKESYGIETGKFSESPAFESAVTAGSKIRVKFVRAECGLEIRKDIEELSHYIQIEKNHGNKIPEDFTGIEIAGSDKVFYPAAVAITGEEKNILEAESPLVNSPLYIRYAWYNYGPVTLFSKEGLPVCPFRNYDDNNSSGHGKIQQLMEL
ncbi:sialate O-acetylesterase [Treponema sp.]|uniref:sialate O-acetylesterase n=1 Tax=Treponema sp. TaxID=166 RepID=UPI0025FD77EC|nr:sialate O-acetylesterase [Treponema sp.]MCR5218172.1 sialate O-acetylesterase [Treponema sp.]